MSKYCSTSRLRAGVVGFTLVELLVVVGIIALLVGLLMPAINSVRAQAFLTQCASNLRQLDTALINYETDNRGLFPPNRYDSTVGATAYWCNENTIGQYVQGKVITGTAGSGFGQLGGPVFTCPLDDRSMRSYAMNVWCSCVSDPPATPGTLWRGSGCGMNINTVLLAERWSTAGTSATTYYSTPTIAAIGVGATPGARFGVGSGVTVTSTHWKPSPISELPYMWHRRPGDGGVSTQSYGRVNIAYTDGRVECKLATELADRMTGLSKMDSVWSPLDFMQNGP